MVDLHRGNALIAISNYTKKNNSERDNYYPLPSARGYTAAIFSRAERNWSKSPDARSAVISSMCLSYWYGFASAWLQ